MILLLMMNNPEKKVNKYKTIWISDVHLGAKRAKSQDLLNFLKHNHCGKLFIIGDLFDGWQLKKNFYWEAIYTDLILYLLNLVKNGCQVVYLTGNHDEFLRKHLKENLHFHNLTITDRYVYESKGNKYLVIHGDQYDLVTRYQKWIAVFGDKLYGILIFLNRILNFLRRSLKLEPWWFSKYAKRKVKQAVNMISNYEKSLIAECQTNGYRGIICGHTHSPSIKKIGNYYYYNSGDWVESLSALVEDDQGNITLTYLENEAKK